MNLLAQRRREKGLTQEELAQRLGTNAARLSELERRPLPARLYRLRDIANILDLKVEDFIGGEK